MGVWKLSLFIAERKSARIPQQRKLQGNAEQETTRGNLLPLQTF